MINKFTNEKTYSDVSQFATYVARLPSAQTFTKHCLCLLVVFVFFSGCVHIPVSSNLNCENKLQGTLPLDEGDVLVIYGENAGFPAEHIMKDYFTLGCKVTFESNSIDNLILAILQENPLPGKFTVKHLRDVQKSTVKGPWEINSILSRLNISKAQVSNDHLRYAIHVKEDFEATTHLPLYAAPFGAATCGNKTVLNADIWDLYTEKLIGSLIVTAKGEYVAVGYIVTVIVFPETQKDATKELAGKIIGLLDGLKQNQNTRDRITD